MKSATLSGIEYIEESSDWSTDTLIFNCTFDNVSLLLTQVIIMGITKELVIY